MYKNDKKILLIIEENNKKSKEILKILSKININI